MNEQKQQVVEKVKAANNVLVTVSNNPSVDQLAACIGLTLLLNKMGKHATAVFSGAVPSTLEFLKPADTIEKNTDSLRDFIIAIDKNKADKLRYKVEDEVVKIFITPYKYAIDNKDLIFSQGDFNVDVVLALGIQKQHEVDDAIMAHGRILHDATVISINTTDSADLGTMNWLDKSASSVSELSAALATDLAKDQLDKQISTALLTGIVAATDHFGNAKTTPATLTVSATLLAAGANQQLVAAQLGKGGDAAPNRQQNSNNQKGKQPNEKAKDVPAKTAEKPVELEPALTIEAAPEQETSEDSLEAILQKADREVGEAPVELTPIQDETPVEADDADDAQELDLGKLNSPDADKAASPLDDMPPFELMDSEPKSTQDSAAPAEPLLGLDPTPTPALDLPPVQVNEPPAQGSPAEPALQETEPAAVSEVPDAPEAPDASVEGGVDSARKAVEDALKGIDTEPVQDMGALPVDLGLGHEAEAAVPAPDIAAPTTVLPDYLTTQPAGMPAAPPAPEAPPVLPGPVAPATPPSQVINEQAPLANSPADQPITMPLPPMAGPAAPLAPPPAGFAAPPAGLQVPPPLNMPPTSTGLPPQGPPPPPAPPPLIHHGF